MIIEFKEDQMSIFDYSKARALAAEALDYRALRQDLIASNIANISTPMYRPKDINFEQMLAKKSDEIFNTQRDLKLDVALTDPNHLVPVEEQDNNKATTFYRDGHLARNDGNSVDIDVESSELGKNQVMYQALIGAMRKHGGIYTNAIDSSKSL